MNDDDTDVSPPGTPSVSPYSQKECHKLLNLVHYPDSPLPIPCEKYPDVKMALQRKNSNKATHAIAFQGMHSGQANAAMVARENGQLHHAQIQRRMTNSKPRLW
jgi:hypothetical protein